MAAVTQAELAAAVAALDAKADVIIAKIDALAARAGSVCGLPYDVFISFACRFLRMFNYGAIAPVFFAFMSTRGFSATQTGALLTAILLGDLVITLYLSTRADSFGRRRTLVIASALKVVAGVAFGLSTDYAVLVVAGIVGVISTSGGEIGPFMAVEQAVLTDALAASRPAKLSKADESAAVATLIGWYTALGYVAQALGAEESVELGQRETSERVVAMDEDDERGRLARRGEAAGEQVDAGGAPAVNPLERLHLRRGRLASEQREIGGAGGEGGHRDIAAGEVRLNARGGEFVFETQLPARDDGRERGVAPDADHAVRGRRRHDGQNHLGGARGDEREQREKQRGERAHHWSFSNCARIAAGPSGR
jgi:hypothetical protein